MTVPPLRANDAQDILDTLHDLDRSRTGKELMHKVLAHLETLIPSLSSSFNWFAEGRIDYLVHPALPPEDTRRLERVMLRNWRENPLVAHFSTHNDDRVLQWRDVVDEAEWHSSPLYKEFYLPLGIKDQLGLRLPSPPDVIAGLVVNGDHVFDGRDAAVFAHVASHVALRLGAVAEGEAMRVALDGLGWSKLSVDDDGRILGDAAASLAPLIGDDRRLVSELHELISNPVPARFPNNPHVITTPRGSFRAIVARNALPPHSLFVYAVDSSLRRDQLTTLTAAGLSPRESEVAAVLHDGATNSAIAGQLGISIGTVKKHVERIFRALGVHNRTAAANAIRRLLEPAGSL
jgi:DNA-binding CsgD family transcriptional regulator